VVVIPWEFKSPFLHKGIAMYKTFKSIVSKHTTEADIAAWKGFILGMAIAISIIGPLVSLALIFIFGEHNDIDDMIVDWLSKFVGIWFN
jgi:hypothetical protein